MSAGVWGNDKTQFFDSLSPDRVLDAIEELGIKTTGRVMQLGSMENRVYEVEVDCGPTENISEQFRVLKFYRPGRWSKDQIQDEHTFLFDLVENDIHAIAPLKFNNESVFETSQGLFYTVFPKQGGRACVEWNDELLAQMGRLLARLHSTGKTSPATHRLELNLQTFGVQNLELILNSAFLPKQLSEQYQSVCNDIFEISPVLFEGIEFQRIHGDCHHGNILLKNEKPFLIDFDDMSMGPKVQDIWMITPGRDEYSTRQRNILIDAYETMCEFDYKELRLVEVLRSLRIIHFSAWIGHRYQDQAFKSSFPDYGTHQYWEKEIFDLGQQLLFIKDSVASAKSFNS